MLSIGDEAKMSLSSMKRITFLNVILGSLYFGVVQANLFEGRQNIISLNRSTFHSGVINQNEYILCNFYLDSCGNCQKLSFILKQFANEIRLWRRVVKIVTVNCETEKQLCGRLGLTRYPATFLIPPNSKEPHKEWEKVETKYSVTIDALYEAVLKKLTSERHILRYQLMPLFAHNKQEVCNMFDSNDQRDKYVIVDHRNSKSTFGTMVILDMLYFQKYVEARNVIGSENLFSSLLPYQIDIPAILKVDVRDCIFRATIISTEPKAIRFKFIQHIEEQYPDVEVPQEEQDPIRTFDKMVKQSLTYIDLNNALRVIVLEEIPARKIFNQKQVDVMKEFFATVLHYFPFNNENVRRLFKRLNNWLANKQGGLTTVRYQEAVKISDGFLPPMQSWRHCRPATAYGCGLWLIFHMMTVHEYHLNRRHKNQTHQVLPAMRNYINTFTEWQMNEDMEEQLVYSNSSVLWLWRSHNNVNKRLLEQTTWNRSPGTDHPSLSYPKEIFPTQKQCAKCFEPSGQYFKENMVLEFLTEYYNKTVISKNSSIRLDLNVCLLICILLSGNLLMPMMLPNNLWQ